MILSKDNIAETFTSAQEKIKKWRELHKNQKMYAYFYNLSQEASDIIIWAWGEKIDWYWRIEYWKHYNLLK